MWIRFRKTFAASSVLVKNPHESPLSVHPDYERDSRDDLLPSLLRVDAPFEFASQGDT